MQARRQSSQEREARWRTWMTAAQRGDSAAYEKLLVELLPYLRRFVRRRLADADAGEDVVQTVFLSIHRARHTYRPERPFGPWLHSVARNAVIDFARAQARRCRRETSLEAEGVPEPIAVAHASPPAGLSPELDRALEALPDSQREAVVLLHLEGLSVAEAASWVGISKGALKVRAHRGVRALRGLLGGESR
jgi:RNA polymerase sigma-70 factor (ECF subfamily)